MKKMKKSTAFIVWVSFFLLVFVLAVKAFGQDIEICYEENAQVELAVYGGTRVLIDVYNPDYLIAPVTSNDILLTSHFHDDHFKKAFADGFIGKKLQMEEGELKTSDVNVKAIVGSHVTSLPPAKIGSNYIFIIDMANMRIVHFGDQEPESLTTEQLDSLGKVDIAIMLFDVDTTNKYYNMMDKLKPALIIPTHLRGGAAKYSAQKWTSYWLEDKVLVLTKDILPDQTSFLFMGMFARGYGKLLKLQQWKPSR